MEPLPEKSLGWEREQDYMLSNGEEFWRDAKHSKRSLKIIQKELKRKKMGKSRE